jgi:hypothetical protein
MILPCPFCGCTRIRRVQIKPCPAHPPPANYLQCDNPRCYVWGPFGETIEHAEELWNTRKP